MNSWLSGQVLVRTIYDKPGRPAKGTVSFNADVKPGTRSGIKLLAKKLGCTQGETIDYLLFKAKHQGKKDQVDASIATDSRRIPIYKPSQSVLNELVRLVKEEVIQELKPAKSTAVKRKKKAVRY
jgi:hypothetical protein